MDLSSTKVFVALIFGLWRFFWGILPVKLDRFLRKWEGSSTDSRTFINEKRHQQITCYVALTQSFGGGVLFATCFLHIMKELFLSVEEVKSNWGVMTDYPVSQLIIAFGFFFIYFLEEFTHWMVNNGKKKLDLKHNSKKVSSSTSRTPKSQPDSARSNRSFKPTSKAKISPVKAVATIEEWELNQKNQQLIEYNYESNINTPEKQNKETPTVQRKGRNSLQRTISAKSRHSIQEEIDRANNAIIEEEKLRPEEEENIKGQENLMRCVLTIAALSLHSLLEGLSIGIQKFKYEIWYLFVAMSIHSASILFCMGVELILAQTRTKFIVIQMAALAMASPLGILLGLLVTIKTSLRTTTMSIITVVLEGLSAGTILYITFFEVLNREKERRVYRLKRSLCIMGGFLLMALLQYSECRYEKHSFLEPNGEVNSNVTVINVDIG
ncbi:uncharacterized protein LOC126742932 [Anthonomus grandis grandis]|uniref:uncharacterized protein LOC126742932 n=1 Tax=Anthonomus grandis grandis TaxID=2921223 RepID=UPI002165E6D5|nr:uncharacterized protein LOC126742932 [Anthonomus grandis grandis]